MAERVLAGAVADWADEPCKVVSVGDAPVLVLRQGEAVGVQTLLDH